MNLSAKNTQVATATENDHRWPLLVAHEWEADGKFYYSVKTTGVYCRRSCAACLSRTENVQFHATCVEAERAGFRPCKRCKPNEPSLVEQHEKGNTNAWH
jgi:AraC family transcriptional regulator of adaptative response/methylated-DNA-[protein]-cysteine methyltransferase